MLLTFDDGYRDNFDLAVPILGERNIPATFFVPSAFLESPRLPWWDQVAYVIKRAPLGRLVLDCDPKGGRPRLEIDLRTVSRTDAITTIIRAFLDATITDERLVFGPARRTCHGRHQLRATRPRAVHELGSPTATSRLGRRA